MWQVEHTDTCKDHNRVHVVRSTLVVEDTFGDTLDADPFQVNNSDVLSAECADCGALAVWEGVKQ